MFKREITLELENWISKTNRKPLVLRGARQVGKTTLVNQFGLNFEQYIYLNLELPDDREPFSSFTTIENLIQALFFIKNKSLSKKNSTLIFIDEIQQVPKALNLLRYFYEKEPGIAVIAAGSMLETLFDKNISFPVGRVEYKVVRPVSFPEFLLAMGETEAYNHLSEIPAEPYSHNKLLALFHRYALIGGMPEVVSHYSSQRDLTALFSIYDSLITSYLDDVEKYAANYSQVTFINHAIRTSFASAGKRIKFAGFGNSTFRSVDMSDALKNLEKALLIQLVFPCTSATLPILPDVKKSPKLQVLDSGMINYFVGIQKEILSTADLSSVYQGTLIEHLVGQELLANQYNSLSSLIFWVREKNSSTAEVDYLFLYEGKLIPIEVKSGTAGTLKSLHLFMDLAPHNLAIRFYAGELKVTKSITSKGKEYFLLNLPYYLVSKVAKYIEWFQNQIGKFN